MLSNIFLFINTMCLLFSLYILYKALIIAKKRITITHNIINNQVPTMKTLSETESHDIYTIMNSNILIYLVNVKTKEKLTYIQKFPCTVGRDADISILDDPTISRRHFILTIESNNIYIEDLNSTNGTWVNEKRLLEKQKISNNDMIHIGNYVFLVEIEKINFGSIEK